MNCTIFSLVRLNYLKSLSQSLLNFSSTCRYFQMNNQLTGQMLVKIPKLRYPKIIILRSCSRHLKARLTRFFSNMVACSELYTIIGFQRTKMSYFSNSVPEIYMTQEDCKPVIICVHCCKIPIYTDSRKSLFHIKECTYEKHL